MTQLQSIASIIWINYGTHSKVLADNNDDIEIKKNFG